MSDERFDNLMKKNLDSVRPAYQPRAWDRFRKRLPLVGVWPWLVQYGGWGVSGLMLAGWLMTLYTLHANQQVLAQLSKIRETPVSPVPTKSTPAVQAGCRVDTVYIVKRTVIEHRYRYATSDDWVTDRGGRMGSAQRLVRGIVGSNAPPTEETTYPSKGNAYVRAKPGRSQVLPASPGQIPVNKDPDAGKNTGNNAAGLRPALDLASRQSDSLSQKRSIASASPAATRPDSVTHKPEVIPPPFPAVQPAAQSRPAFRWASLQPRLGIEAMATPSGFGIGPAIELFPLENLGFSVGLQASQLHLENHHALNDFNSATGKDFVDQYRAFLPAQYDKIEDISIQTAVISVPIRFNYYVPLRQRWSLLVQAGTRLDVAAYQQVRYESYFRTDEQYHSFEVKAAHRLFHNFLFGAGFQYRKPRLSLQFTPYYLYDFRSIMNTPTGNNFGLKASVWLDLFK